MEEPSIYHTIRGETPDSRKISTLRSVKPPVVLLPEKLDPLIIPGEISLTHLLPAALEKPTTAFTTTHRNQKKCCWTELRNMD